MERPGALDTATLFVVDTADDMMGVRHATSLKTSRSCTQLAGTVSHLAHGCTLHTA